MKVPVTNLDTKASMRHKLCVMIERIANTASGVKRKLSYLLVVGVMASAYLAWSLYSSESVLWWNIIKCMSVVLPGLVWAFVWSVLGQIEQAPSQVANLVSDDDGILTRLAQFNASESQGLRGLFGLLREFHKEDGLGDIFDTIGGVTILVNPLFAILAFMSLLMLFGVIITALLVWLI